MFHSNDENCPSIDRRIDELDPRGGDARSVQPRIEVVGADHSALIRNHPESLQ